MLYKNTKVLSTEGLVFTAIGKVVVRTVNDWNIPHLHFAINEASDGIFEAVCIELSEFASGKTIDEAVKNITLHLLNFLSENIKSADDIDQIIEKINTNDMDEYWREYRVIDANLAKVGNNIHSCLERDLRNEIEKEYDKIYEDKIRKLFEDKTIDNNSPIGKIIKLDDVKVKKLKKAN